VIKESPVVSLFYPQPDSSGRLSQVGAVQTGMIALIMVVLLIGAAAYWQTQQSAHHRHAKAQTLSPAVTEPEPTMLPDNPQSEPALLEPALALYPARFSLVTDANGQLVGCSGIVGDAQLQQQLIQQMAQVFVGYYQPCDVRYDAAYQPELMDINAVTRLAQILRQRPDVMIAINPLETIPSEQVLGSKGAVVIGAPSPEEFAKIESAVREQTGNAFSLHALQAVDVTDTVLSSVQTANQMFKMLPTNPRPADITALLNQQVIRFGFNESEVPPLNQPLLELVAPYLNQYPELQLQIQVFTAAVGSSQYNLELSKRRAEALRQFWIAQGVKPQQLLAVGMGQQQPIAENATEQGRFWNERVQFYWVTPEQQTSPEASASRSSDVPKP
jgi:outer membrane protein OmpA-like peptidoglycan-associated protein